MKKYLKIRKIVKELLDFDDLIISYVELPDNGFDLSVRFEDYQGEQDCTSIRE